eukprot:362142-Chlamydomonas_euryale.AAC.6
MVDLPSTILELAGSNLTADAMFYHQLDGLSVPFHHFDGAIPLAFNPGEVPPPPAAPSRPNFPPIKWPERNPRPSPPAPTSEPDSELPSPAPKPGNEPAVDSSPADEVVIQWPSREDGAIGESPSAEPSMQTAGDSNRGVGGDDGGAGDRRSLVEHGDGGTAPRVRDDGGPHMQLDDEFYYDDDDLEVHGQPAPLLQTAAGAAGEFEFEAELETEYYEPSDDEVMVHLHHSMLRAEAQVNPLGQPTDVYAVAAGRKLATAPASPAYGSGGSPPAASAPPYVRDT